MEDLSEVTFELDATTSAARKYLVSHRGNIHRHGHATRAIRYLWMIAGFGWGGVAALWAILLVGNVPLAPIIDYLAHASFVAFLGIFCVVAIVIRLLRLYSVWALAGGIVAILIGLLPPYQHALAMHVLHTWVHAAATWMVFFTLTMTYITMLILMAELGCRIRSLFHQRTGSIQLVMLKGGIPVTPERPMFIYNPSIPGARWVHGLGTNPGPILRVLGLAWSGLVLSWFVLGVSLVGDLVKTLLRQHADHPGDVHTALIIAFTASTMVCGVTSALLTWIVVRATLRSLYRRIGAIKEVPPPFLSGFIAQAHVNLLADLVPLSWTWLVAMFSVHFGVVDFVIPQHEGASSGDERLTLGTTTAVGIATTRAGANLADDELAIYLDGASVLNRDLRYQAGLVKSD